MSVADRTTRAQPASGGGLLTRLLAKRRTLVMGVLNVTPDSFSDGGRFLDPANAIMQAERLAAEGADIIDVGAESSRPYVGAVLTSLDDELARLAPVLPAVIGLGVPVSIDTMKAKVAAWAVEAGATIVNDVWGLQRDPDMAKVVAELGTPLVIMHNREQADGSDRHHGRHRSLLCALARHCRARRHPARPHRARSRHRLRQDPTAEHRRHSAACAR